MSKKNDFILVGVGKKLGNTAWNQHTRFFALD